ncbi:MAG: hypothetical protein JWP25_8567 [Bradyrhizobium sp.]|nr:hypothetical protein [Bradyrhizobium sp.]
MAGDLPTVHLVAAKIYVRYERSVFAIGGGEQFHGVLAGRCNDDLESPIGKGFFNDTLNEMVIFNDQDNR